LKLQVLAIGKVREHWYRDAIDDYRRRIGKHMAITVLEADKEHTGNEKDLESAYLKIRAEHVKADLPVALDMKGRAMSSEELAAWLESAMVDGKNLVSFLVGGPHGLPASASRDSRMILSLSTMTLPHQMARLILMEQIYRALSIIRGEPYHK
jgi:23S rRNA (pseudouridine1915-N3)-methyltransferase